MYVIHIAIRQLVLLLLPMAGKWNYHWLMLFVYLPLLFLFSWFVYRFFELRFLQLKENFR
ncbi:MAG: hypothetical protein C4308_00050 [Chitinophagaceae bacterium]